MSIPKLLSFELSLVLSCPDRLLILREKPSTSFSAEFTCFIVDCTSTPAKFLLSLFRFVLAWLSFAIICGTSRPIIVLSCALVVRRFAEIAAALCSICCRAGSLVRRVKLVRIESIFGMRATICGTLCSTFDIAPSCGPPLSVSPRSIYCVGLGPRTRFIVTPPMSDVSSSAFVPLGTRISLSSSTATTTLLVRS